MIAVRTGSLFCLVALAGACTFDQSGVDFDDTTDDPGVNLAPGNVNDHVPAGPFPDGGVVSERCLIISEYIEGQGNYNKAIELYNCGSTPLQLGDFGVCLVRNTDSECSNTYIFSAATLDPGQVRTACRTKDGTDLDPIDSIRDNCQDVAGTALSFNGDDRLVVFHDADADGAFGGDDAVMDALGVIATPPADMAWSDVDLRRCNFTPADGTTEFVYTDYFTAHDRHDASDFGVAPSEGC